MNNNTSQEHPFTNNSSASNPYNVMNNVNKKKEVYHKQIFPKENFCRDCSVYRKLAKIGQGTFGQVYKAEYVGPKPFHITHSSLSHSPTLYALKKILMNHEKEGFPITALREIMILKKLDHENIIPLIEIVTSKPRESNHNRGNVYLVFEYMDHDLSGLVQLKTNFEAPVVKCIMFQLLKGIQYLHEQGIIHRDIKSANILLNNKGQIKIGDFGLARIMNANNKGYTNRVVTLWYRAPELLFGTTTYDGEIDVWSAGCIFSELLTGVTPFKGKKNEYDEVERICEKLGNPNETNWPGVTKLPFYNQLIPRTNYSNCFKDFYKDNPKVDDQCFDLLQKMLTLNPEKRISIKDALNHPYFTEGIVKMCKMEDMPKFERETHEYDYLQEMREKNKDINNKIINGKLKEMTVGNKEYKNNYNYSNNINKYGNNKYERENKDNINNKYYNYKNKVNSHNKNVNEENLGGFKDKDNNSNNKISNLEKLQNIISSNFNNMEEGNEKSSEISSVNKNDFSSFPNISTSQNKNDFLGKKRDKEE